MNLPTLAKIDRINGSNDYNKLIALENPLSPEVDSFRMLRMNIQSISNWQSLRTILFTSAEPSVGKSVTGANLAIVMAHYGNRVILVDADLRKPSIHKLFGINNDKGLLNLIFKSNLSVSECLKKTKIENLLILTSGSEEISSVEALGSEIMKNIIKELSLLADIVIIDSPPALLFSDTFLIGKLVSGVIIVSRVGKTPTDLLKRVADELRMAGINLLGVVIQQSKSSDKYGHQYYRYYSESGKDPKKSKRTSMEQKAGRLIGRKQK